MILAYIDPGTGWLALQALLAAVLAIPFLFRRALTRTMRRFQGKPDVEPGSPAEHDHAGQDANSGGKGDA